ncbi:MAG: hypothetical protein AAGA64_03740 [Bacteroidota bacterium]
MKKAQILTLVRIIIYAAYLLALSLVFLYDARSTEGKFYENSLTEYFQEGTFLLTVLAYLFCTFNYKNTAPLSLLLGGFFLMAFIREFDAVLDAYVYDGAWQTLVLLVIALVGYRSFQSRKPLLETIPDYMVSYPFGLMIGGMLVTFIYSRLFGETIMWKAVMEENYVRDVKNAVEESVELLGDSIILFAGLEFIFWAKGKNS